MDKKNFLQQFMTEIWNNKQIEKIPDYVHEEYTIHLDTADPWEGQTLSHAEFKKRLFFSFDAFPDIHFEITTSIEDKNHVAISWILTGTHTGPIGHFPPSGRSIKTLGMTIYHFTDGLISGHTQVFDRMTVAQQLGLAS